MELEALREKIDEIDKQLVALFERRLAVCADIGRYKQENGLAVTDTLREGKKLAQIAGMCGEDTRELTSALYSQIFELSKTYQRRVGHMESDLCGRIEEAMETTDKLFPDYASVACQGIEGAYSQIACEKLFKTPAILYFKSFEGVFSAIEKGMCRYGVLPVENSTAGSVNQVYDLMSKHKFSIVRSIRLKVDHSLLAREGATLAGIKEIYSHEQALSQCAEFIKSLGDVKITPCENTAVAAKMVADSGRTDVAAISSHYCAGLYGLSCLKQSVQDNQSNFTRFICISKQLEIYPGADKTSIMAVTPHKPGALYRLLSRFNAVGVNLLKLESRPLPDRDFEFMFYFDLEKPIYSPETVRLMGELGSLCESFEYLGSYSEVV